MLMVELRSRAEPNVRRSGVMPSVVLSSRFARTLDSGRRSQNMTATTMGDDDHNDNGDATATMVAIAKFDLCTG